jgi:hypothetical protein
MIDGLLDRALSDQRQETLNTVDKPEDNYPEAFEEIIL